MRQVPAERIRSLAGDKTNVEGKKNKKQYQLRLFYTTLANYLRYDGLNKILPLLCL